MSNIMEQMLEESKKQLEIEFEHKKELARIMSCNNNEIKELKAKHKKQVDRLNKRINELTKANDTFGFIVDYIKEYLGKKTICPKDVEDVLTEIKTLKENGKCQK